MSTEIELSDNIKMIRFFGGAIRGRCFDFIIEETKEKMTISET